MSHVLVTGAAGFLGRHLVNALDARGDFVVELVRDASRGERLQDKQLGRGAIVWGDLTGPGALPLLERAIAEYEVDAVVHLAAQTQVSVGEADPVGTLETNVRGTWVVLEACRRQKVRRIICASSDKCYGDGPSPYREDQPLLPHGVYATSKACADMLAQSYARDFGMSIAVTRCGNLYGPGHLNFSTLIPGTIRSVIRGERPYLRSDGSQRRDYLYVGDAVRGYLKLLDVPSIGLFNFGTGVATSVIDVVELILAVAKSDLRPEIAGGARGEIRAQYLDWSLAREVLGWAPTGDFKLHLAETLAWYRTWYTAYSRGLLT